MSGLLIAVIVLIVVIFLFVLLQRAGGLGFPWVPFYVKGKESGFSFKETHLMRRIAVENRLSNPTSLFWSLSALDRCIRATIIRFRSEERENSPEALQFLSHLFDFRKRVEFDQPKYKLGIQSTRSLTPGQTLKLTLPGAGAFFSRVIENNRRHLAVTYPTGPKSLPPGTSWRGQDVAVYFWRKDDAGYYFETKVLGDYLDRKVPILHLQHSDELSRTQKRSSVRAPVNRGGALYPLRSIENANETIEKRPGYRCKVLDISEDGAAVVVGGKAKAGLPIKVQTRLNSETVVLCGTVRSANYKQKNNVSVLHMQAVKPSTSMRVKILTFVYRLFRKEEEQNELR